MSHAPADTAPIRLADYRPPAWRVEHAELAFELGLEETVVRARLALRRDPDQPASGLRLDGEDLGLEAVKLDGRLLGPAEYVHDAGGLSVPGADADCVLETVVRVRPAANTRLEGLYASRGMLLTQCEAEGFRRITFFTDRPDVMPTWRIVLRGDREAFPVLLANGNPVARQALDDGRHEATWENPHRTPAYLFAVVAGRLEAVGRDVTTAEGRAVRLNVWSAPEDLPRCGFALEALERALRWDEQRFGRHYDLDVFNLVAAQDFTMGAMENKGLNIFNARYVLADPETATDADYLAIESVIGHEYFHNWSGNRVTLRDWFQLSLKEGLTVFRDQEFTADLHSRAVKRIEDVRLLRARQFAEDAGALAHPVRPAEYREINNFYTLTVYEKGAEIVRILHTLLGEAGFRAGLDRYFADNDGRAATVEDFLAAFEASSGRDLAHFARWYAQAGTPALRIEDDFDAAAGRYTLRIHQHTPPTPRQPETGPLLVPLRFALHGEDGPLRARVARSDAPVEGDLLLLTDERHALVFEGIASRPLPAFNQGFSAPVKLDYLYTPQQLGRLARVEQDAFNRWEALQRLATGVLLSRFDDLRDAETALSAALGDLLADPAADPAFVAECLVLPDFDTLAEQVAAIDVDGLIAAREDLLDRLAEDHADALEARYHALADAAAGPLDGPSMAARSLRNACLAWLTRLDPHARLAEGQFAVAHVMTDRLGALRCLVRADAPGKDAALAAFSGRFASDALVTDKWLTLVASRPAPEVVEEMDTLLASEWWLPTNPNRVRAILGAFARMNPIAFHRADGAGYRFLATQLPVIEAINPQVAARLLGAFETWARLAGPRRDAAREVLAGLDGQLRSRDCTDLLQRLLGAG